MIQILWLFIFSFTSKTVLAESSKQRRELIRFTPNILTQARYFNLRKAPKGTVTQHNEYDEKDPIVVCSQGTIGIKLEKRLSGRIFVSHHEKNSECRQLLTKETSAHFFTPLTGPCGVQVIRKKHSLEYKIRLIVSYDFDNLTEEDKFYDVTCHYELNNATVSTYYDTVGFQARAISKKASMPRCKYSIHRNNLTGPKTSTARVGDLVFHRWTCPPGDFAFKVYRCFVHDGLHRSYMIVDDTGCSLDEEIIPHPSYDVANGMVSTPAKAFRFSKSKRVHFNCLLSVCPLWDKTCMQNIPPKCPRSQKKRQLQSDVSMEERLFRIQSILEGRQRAPDDLLGRQAANALHLNSFSLSTDDLHVEDREGHVFTDCDPTDLVHWIYILCFSNALFVLISLLACSQLMKNRYTVRIQKPRKHLNSHFRF